MQKTVLVTGASSGIGASIAKAFAKKGACLSLTGRNEERLSLIAEECEKLGAPQVVRIVADLNEKAGIEKTVNETRTVYDKLDVLINNAGLLLEGGTENTNFEDFNTLCNVNLRAPFFITQLCMSLLEKVKGNVINISSIDSQANYTDTVVYGMTKAAIDHFTKTTALEFAPKGIRVNAVNPGMVRTNILSNVKIESELDQYFQYQDNLHPLRQRNIEPDEIADAVLFLSSEDAKMITGTCLNVDGGRVLTRR